MPAERLERNTAFLQKDLAIDRKLQKLRFFAFAM
jgi:hypothetical protein